MTRGFPDHFSERAAEYADRRPGYPTELARYMAGIPERSGLAWDAGAGPGRLAVPLAAHVDRIVATDGSVEQLRGAPRHARIHYRQELAEASSLPGGTVDLAVAAQAAHWFDLEGYYAEVRRVARQGAAIALVSYGMARVTRAVDRVVDRFYGDALDAHWPPERRHVERGYRSLPFPFDEIDPPAFEIRADWTRERMAGYVDTWSAVRALERAGGGDRLRRFHRELERAWPEGDGARTVRWPLSLRVGRV